MRAALEVSEAQLRRRKAWGADRWDEVWDGALHMSPAPSREHQRILDELVAFLLGLLKRTRRGTLHSGINVFDESSVSENYRIPDLTFVAVGRERLLADDGIRGGAPDAVFEIRSPGDESYEKLAFYAELGAREAVFIDRDTKKPELRRLSGREYVAVPPDRDGWVTLDSMRIRLRQSPGSATLEVEDLDDSRNRVEI